MQALWKRRKSVFIPKKRTQRKCKPSGKGENQYLYQKKGHSENASHLENEKISIYTNKGHSENASHLENEKTSIYTKAVFCCFFCF